MELQELLQNVTKEFQPYILECQIILNEPGDKYCWVADIKQKGYRYSDYRGLTTLTQSQKDNLIRAKILALKGSVSKYALVGFISEYEAILIVPDSIEGITVNTAQVNSIKEAVDKTTDLNVVVKENYDGTSTLNFSYDAKSNTYSGIKEGVETKLNAKGYHFTSESNNSKLRVDVNLDLISKNKVYLGKLNPNVKDNSKLSSNYILDSQGLNIIDIIKTYILKGSFDNSAVGSPIEAKLKEDFPDYSTLITKDYYNIAFNPLLSKFNEEFIFSRLQRFVTLFKEPIDSYLGDVIYDSKMEDSFNKFKNAIIASYNNLEESTNYIKEIKEFLNDKNYIYFMVMLYKLVEETSKGLIAYETFDPYITGAYQDPSEEPGKEMLKLAEDTCLERDKILEKIKTNTDNLKTLQSAPYSPVNAVTIADLQNKISADKVLLKQKEKEINLFVNPIFSDRQKMSIVKKGNTYVASFTNNVERSTTMLGKGITKSSMISILNGISFNFTGTIIEDDVIKEQQQIESGNLYDPKDNLNYILTELNTNLTDLIKNIKELTTSGGSPSPTSNYISAAPGAPCTNALIPTIFPKLDIISNNLQSIQKNTDNVLVKP